MRCPGFSRATEAVVAILHRVVDQEESMKSFVTKICSQLWFNPAPVTGKVVTILLWRVAADGCDHAKCAGHRRFACESASSQLLCTVLT